MPTNTHKTTVLRIAVPTPLYRVFDYLPPQGEQPESLNIGARFKVPFGRNKQIGVLIGIASDSPHGLNKLKAAETMLDDEPLLPAELLKLLQWAAKYYHHPIGEVISTALPTLLRQGEAATTKQRKLWSLTAEGETADLVALKKRAPRQYALLCRFQKQAQLTEALLQDAPKGWRQTLATLVKKGWAKQEQSSTLAPVPTVNPQLPTLNSAQQKAVNTINATQGFQPYLLDGVTGSGKTEVYLRAVQHVINAYQQVLVLVPEITLTPQLVSRFRQRLNATVEVLHSGLNDRERLNTWLHARSGNAQVIIGTRSAIFTPLKNPGLIIIDEEHDASLKQQTGFRYSARDIAIMRGRNLNIPVVLGSATPGFESLFNVEQKRYFALSLPERAGNAVPPKIRLLDVRNKAMDEMLSDPLLKHMTRHLDDGGQVLLFLNRRGFSPTLMCHECGWVAECRRCDAHMTLHQRSHCLHCHHCGSQRAIPRQCHDCGSTDLRPLGTGTERVDEALKRHFPDIGVSRLDRDSTRRKGSLESILDGVASGHNRILVGTQMLAKGHHFPDVTLVGILDGDQGLFGIDFRAGERMAQLITQVAGRAGRAEKTGTVLIQTHHPDHPFLQLLCEKGYHAFAREALAERHTTALPPYAHMAILRAEANNKDLPTQFLEQAKEAAEALNKPDIELFGPLPSPMERRAGKYRAQLLLQSNQRAQLHQLLSVWIEGLSKLPAARKVRWSIDVDPIDLL